MGLGNVSLVGFNYARRAGGVVESQGFGDYDWESQIYCHPKRQRKAVDPTLGPGGHLGEDVDYFLEKHDVYSIGVVLLELGLWKDLGTFKDARGVLRLYEATPDQRQAALMDLSRTLPRVVGKTYTALVQRCLEVDMTEIALQEVLEQLEDLHF